ncbi:N-acetyltransferase 9 [Aricia agestis]|uniref:N-acetyltransferase 9 n=1 Tax=Aricia agestis TaxID=91739 RepID=UPI001C205DDA|nr:N-acetyltransferase 9 [Aricia agestis]
MKINSRTKIVGENVLLVPYEAVHVPKYHGWMKSKELQELTASEELTLEQEYQMQASWREDEDKCTFIILEKSVYDETKDEVESMIGDTNIFLVDNLVGEIEIMIAETAARRKRCGWESVIMMLLYGIQFINIKEYVAKISMNNSKSIDFFTKLGFEEESRSEIFKEITFKKLVNEQWTSWLREQVKKIEIKNY